jgi:methionyl-tRNA formyltransferase
MGSPSFAVPSLEALIAHADVRAVVTQPDRPAGRGRSLAPPPVKETALAAGIPVMQPQKVKNNPELLEAVRALEPRLIVVVAYGRILPPAILELPPHGCLNVHASLLPKYRGAGPIQWAIARGETETGVSLMRMDAGMDTGPVYAMRRLAIAEDDTAGSLSDKLARLGAEALAELLPRILDGTASTTAQDNDHASHAPLLTKEHGLLDFTKPAREVRDWIRAMDPWPTAHTLLAGEALRLFGAKLVSGNGAAGTVMGLDRDGLLVACGQGAVGIAELQLPGRKRMPARALLAGRPIPTGTKLGV